ncbi:MAG: hypothetical protein SFU27_06160 [Thermonemataceae bacterium]|nr:hypothetical protein [Thermonemataceae bacterium]
MRKIVIISLLLALSSISFAQKKAKTTLKGVIVQKPWTKSTQSYCAQGSAYFVIKVKDKEYVLENQTNALLDYFLNSRVEIKGYFRQKEIKNEPMGQYPIDTMPTDDVFRCTVFVVQSIETKK